MIEAIIFDLGRVLIDIDFTKGLLGGIGSADFDAIKKLAGDQDFIAYSTGKISSQEFHHKVTEKVGINIDYASFTELWCNIFSEMEGMKSIVQRLSKSYPLGLLSDTDTLHWNYITKNFPWIEDCFSQPVLSFENGVMKPDPKAFSSAAGSVGVKPENCLFIDDLDDNIAGAKEFGMQGVLFLGADNLIHELKRLGVTLL